MSEEFIDYLRVKSEEYQNQRTVVASRKALDSFIRYIGGCNLGPDDINDSLLSEWAAFLLYDGYSIHTISFYLKRLSALYTLAVREDKATPTQAFAKVQTQLQAIRIDEKNLISGHDTFHKLRKIIRTDYSGIPDKQLAKDMLMLALACGGLTVGELVSYRKDDYRGDDPKILEIVAQYARPKNKYLFPLDHSSKNLTQLSRTVLLLMQTLLSDVGLNFSDTASNTTIDLWSRAAINCGFPMSDIVACIGQRKEVNLLTAFVRPSSIGPDWIGHIREQVFEALVDNPVHWYVMRFRPRVTYEMITARLKEKNITLQDVYYPMEEILRKVGQRKVFESRPVISWLMFFRERVSELNNLYHHIGDLAWGYRRSRDRNSPYAVISNSEIVEYQRAIGAFSLSSEVPAEDDIQLQPGDRLVVIGGFLNGRPATFDSIVERKSCNGSESSGRTVYRILLDGGKFKDWVVEQDSRLVRKITESQFSQLREQYNDNF